MFVIFWIVCHASFKNRKNFIFRVSFEKFVYPKSKLVEVLIIQIAQLTKRYIKYYIFPSFKHYWFLKLQLKRVAQKKKKKAWLKSEYIA